MSIKSGIFCMVVMSFLMTIAITTRSAEPNSKGEYAYFPAPSSLERHKKVVLISGDEEYRSEEELTQLAKILSTRHGFECVVLYAIDRTTGKICPTVLDHIPGLEHLRDADLAILAIRFRALPPEQMKELESYLAKGRPLLTLRTTTHAFQFPADSPYARFSWKYNGSDSEWKDGFGRKFLGETWIDHHGRHGVEGTRAVAIPNQSGHPILRGFKPFVVPTDVYRIRLPQPKDCTPLLLGQVLTGLDEKSSPVTGEKNNPMMPICWLKTWQFEQGPTGQSVVVTMGSALDMQSEGFRRLLVNSVYWLTGLEKDIQSNFNVDLVGEYHPLPFGFGKFRPDLRPADMEK